MARQDIAGLLTGMPQQQRPNPNMSSAEWRLAFGQQQSDNMARGLQGAVGGLTGAGMSGAASPQEQIQIADLKAQERMATLDMTNLDDLRTLASMQMSRGDRVGAAQTASMIDRKEKEQLALDKETKTRTAVADSLSAAGQPEEAQQVRDGTLSASAGQSLIFQLKGEKRRQKIASDQAAAKLQKDETVSLQNQTLLLKNAGLLDSELADQVSTDQTKDLSAVDFRSLVDLELKERANPYTVKGLKKYVLDNGTEVYGGTTTSKITGESLLQYQTRGADGTLEYVPLPTTATVYKSPDNIKPMQATSTAIKQAKALLALAGKNHKNSPVKDNDAWNSTSFTIYDQEVIATQVVDKTNELMQTKKLSYGEAQQQAIKEVYLDNLTEKETTLGFGDSSVYTAPVEPKGQPAGWTREIDANGVEAYVSPDRTEFQLVTE